MNSEASVYQVTSHLERLDKVAEIYRPDTRKEVVKTYVDNREKSGGLTDQALVYRVLQQIGLVAEAEVWREMHTNIFDISNS